jgi:hypothetical protein
MKHPIAILLVVLLAGCATKTSPSQGSAAPSPGPSITAQSPPTPPSSAPKDSTAPDYLTTQLVLYQSEALGVRLSYPENFDKPESIQQGNPLTLRFRTGEVSISRTDHAPGKSLQDLATEHINANTKASNGRLVMTDLGKQQLGGEEAWGFQSYFDSAAGRTDGVLYLVLNGSFEYRVGCQTKQGPPVIPWEDDKPVCERVLGTIRFGT